MELQKLQGQNLLHSHRAVAQNLIPFMRKPFVCNYSAKAKRLHRTDVHADGYIYGDKLKCCEFKGKQASKIESPSLCCEVILFYML